MRKINLLVCLLMVWAGIACSDDKSDGPSNSPLSPDENKAKLEQIGKDFIAKIHADDHKTITASLKNFYDYAEGSDLDQYFPDFASDSYNTLASSLLRVIEKNDMNALLMAASSVDADEYSWKDYTGIYTYEGNGHWEQATDAGKLEFHYDNAVFKITYSGSHTYDKVDDVVVEFPGEVTAILTVDGKEQLNFTAKTSLTDNKLAAAVNAKLSLIGDYVWEANADAKSDLVKANGAMTVRGEKLMQATAEMRGSNMTDPDKIDVNSDDLGKLFHSANFEFTLMNVRLTGEGNIQAIMTALDKIEGDNDKAQAEKEAEVYNNNTKFEAYYVSENQKFADFKMGAYLEDEYSYNDNHYEYWDIQPYFIFTTDQTPMEFESFFSESGFRGFLDAAEVLANQYAKMLGIEEKVEL